MEKKFTSLMITVTLFFATLSVTVQLSSAVTWSSDIRLTIDPSDDWDPSITQTNDGGMWVTWHSGRTGNYELFYKISSDNGISWSGDFQLTSNASLDSHPSILQSSDERIWIVWDSDRTGDFEIYYKTSIDNGESWSGDTQLTVDPARDSFPSIMQSSDGKIWVFWSSGRNVTVSPPDPTYQLSANIFYKFSSDSGQTWSDDTLLATDYKNNYWDDLYPSCMQAANGSIWVVWAKHAREIYAKTYNGTHWFGEVRLTTDPRDDTHPFIMQTANERIWVFWDSNRNAHDTDIYYKIFDGSWTDDLQLTTSMEDDEWPGAVQTSDLRIWVAWNSPRYPQLVYDIFYRTGTELHDIAVSSVTPYTNHNSNAFAYRGEIAYVGVEVENQGEGKEIFAVKCYANSTQLGQRIVTLDAGKSFVSVFEWNTTKVKAGVYVPNAVAVAVQGETDISDNYLVGDSFEVRIWGDVCGWFGGVLMPIPNQRVNLDDFMVIVFNYGAADPSWNPVWGPACDITEDGVVDIDDVMTVSIHYGET